MINIIVKTENSEMKAAYNDKILISEVLENLGLIQNKPCGGIGICGKCKIKAVGELSSAPDCGTVLSCQTYALGDVYIDYTTDNIEIQGITNGFMPEFEKDPLTENRLGMAIDIGTTTIAAYLYKFPECKCIKTICIPNTQAQFGADVISRIEYANSGGLVKLQNAVKEQINKITNNYKIDIFVITGNTTMLHLLTGLDPKNIAVSPFIPESLFGHWTDNVYLPKCISAYVGADITTAILASGMLNDKTSFMVDIGTNGEMALWHNNELVCCSTAAGPAFEGAGISQGTPAVSGAINKVYIENGKIKYTSIDDEKPIGICGTGLIDAIACMLKLYIIDDTGYLEEAFELGDSNIFITPEDVRQVQLAKSAIRAGIDTLVSECGITFEEIDKFYIAGGFGSFIDKYSSAKIGLIPNEVLDKVMVLGNAAGSGAAMILQSKKCLEQSEKIAEIAQTVELSTNKVFMEKYIENMMF